MPLIDTVIEVTVKQRTESHLIVREKDATEYMFDPGRGEYIENETLHIRVAGLDRNLGSGKPDELLGVVVASELKLPDGFRMPVDLIESGTFDPIHQYGPTAAKDFFPEHFEGKWRCLTFSFNTPISEEDVNKINSASDKLDGGDHQEAMEMISEVLGRIPWMIDLYHVMGALAVSHNHPGLAEKYYTMGIKVAETVLPETDDFILDYREPGNGFYLSLMHSLADQLVRTGNRDKALELYRKCYRLMPQDPGGVRIALQELTGKAYPQMDEKGREFYVDPYLHYARYKDIPIRDGYDPSTKPDFTQWLKWDESYRRLLIYNAHISWFASQKLSEKEMFMHLLMHDMVESSLARNDPPDLRLHLARMVANGASRHDALHSIGEAIIADLAEQRRQMKANEEAHA